MQRAEDDRVIDHVLFKGQTRPKLVNVAGYELTYQSRIYVIMATVLMTVLSTLGASATGNPWAMLWALGLSASFGIGLFVAAIRLCKVEPRWAELARWWFVTRFEAALSGSLAFWKGSSAFSPLVIDLPDRRGRRHRTVSLLLRKRK